MSTLNLISSEEVNPLESGDIANERQDEESFALAEIKQGRYIINPHMGVSLVVCF